jgi:hypothetical protein
MIGKTITAITASTLLMATSPARPVPIYVHCNAPSEAMATQACKQLVKNLRDRDLRRSVAPLRKTSDRAGVGVHITFHMTPTDGDSVQGFLSWGNAGNEPLSQQNISPKVSVETNSLHNNFNPLIDQLIVLSEIEL